MPTCIYCQRTDPPRGFTREHVIPEALGLFHGDVVTLTSEVCGDCNQWFGDHLDRVFARDSAEAVLRFKYGLKDPAGVTIMFADRVTVRLPNDGSQWGGVILKFVAPPKGQEVPAAELMTPQVGFERNDQPGTTSPRPRSRRRRNWLDDSRTRTQGASRPSRSLWRTRTV